jgi:hypothetical protein
MATSTPATSAWRLLGRVIGLTGLATVVLFVLAVAVGTRQEPGFDAPAIDVLTYYRSGHTPATQFRSFALVLGSVTFVWFVVGLSILLRRAEGEVPWRSTIALVSGALLPALVLSGNEVATAFHADDLDPQIARYAFDEAQVAFANARVALGSFAVCCGWVIAATGFLPRWLGWLVIVIGAAFILSRISWTSGLWLLPYALFWLWVITVSVLLLLRNFRGAPPATPSRF